MLNVPPLSISPRKLPTGRRLNNVSGVGIKKRGYVDTWVNTILGVTPHDPDVVFSLFHRKVKNCCMNMKLSCWENVLSIHKLLHFTVHECLLFRFSLDQTCTWFRQGSHNMESSNQQLKLNMYLLLDWKWYRRNSRHPAVDHFHDRISLPTDKFCCAGTCCLFHTGRILSPCSITADDVVA